MFVGRVERGEKKGRANMNENAVGGENAKEEKGWDVGYEFGGLCVGMWVSTSQQPNGKSKR